MSLLTTAELHNGTKIPVLGLGVYKVEEGDEVYESVKSALEIGYRHIDTASFYQNEEGVGRAIKESGVPREEIFVTTKVWNDEQGYQQTLDAFDRSLTKLGMDYVDLYLVHWPVKGKYKDTYRALENLYREGKAKAIGVSNFLPHHLEDLMNEAEIKPMVNQIELHPQLLQNETYEYCQNHNIVVEAWSPIGRGKYLDDPVLTRIAEKYGKTAAQVILRWDLEKGIVTIPKSVRAERQKENAAVFDFALTAEEVRQIDSLNQNENGRLGPHPDQMS